MALQVWLPLNGDIKNRGVSDLEFNNGSTSNLVLDNSGKIGKCYQRTTYQTSGYIGSTGTINLSEDITITCWAYVMNCVGDTANGLVTNHSHGDNTGVGITVKQISTTDYRISCNTGTGSGRTYCTYYGTTNIKNSWHHLSLTYSKQLKQLKLYVDGNVEYTLNNYNNASKSDYVRLFEWSTAYDSNNYRPAAKLNDVRVYDHCLSASEVKDISKGLVLHYPLNHIEPTGKNLVTSLSPGGQTTVNGNKVTTSGVNADTYFTINLSENIVVGKTYKLTCVGNNIPVNGHFDFPMGWQGNTNYTLPIKNGYNEYIFTANDGSWGSNRLFMDDNGRSTAYMNQCEFSNFHFYNLTDGGSMVYDCSGYGNNGVIASTSAPIIANDSRRYSISSKFDTTSKYISVPNIPATSIANSYTIAWWGKTPSYKMFWGFSNGNRLNMPYSGLYCNTGDGSSNPFYKPGTTTTITPPSTNAWHHYVCVGNGTDVKLYVDGVHYGTAKTYKSITGTSLIINGWDTGTSYKVAGMQMNDFRIYATALSASDVQELYDTSVKITKNGTLMCYELKED